MGGNLRAISTGEKMDGNTALVIMVITYAIYLGWCRWLDRNK